MRRRQVSPGVLGASPWLFGAMLLAGWFAVARWGGLPAYVLPSPDAVLARLVADLINPTLWPYVAATVAEAVGGCVIGAAVALPLGIAIHRSRLLDAAVSPFLGATQAIPAIALAPLLVLWVGYGLGPVMWLCSLLVFFPILVSTVTGLKLVPASVVDAARLDGAGSFALLASIELPMALPNLLAGLRNGFTLSVTGAVMGEMIMGGRGLGQLLTAQRDALDTTGMFATIALLVALAMGLYGLIRAIELRSAVMADLTTPR
ncbi:ABC transporter permease [Propioniciclava soli]|uniref:ABC transporter permease n=1 Tax=Propioniciclava soli TaxID=2775081 RepID=UPI001E54F500